MKKIININFHGRVIPIEETAYEILKQYVATLRAYFANEEGRDEIINDIENRFAELFSETLKKGATCITDADVEAIITSMGRPEDFEEEERAGTSSGSGSAYSQSGTTGAGSGAGSGSTGSSQQGANSQQQTYPTDEPHRLYRSDNDKILGGVCAGLANYMRLDPAVVRILFAFITLFWGAGFLLYIIFWAVLPTRSLPVNARKRLYRNMDGRVLGGVASGLSAYFHLEVWIFRLIFALPLIASLVTSIFRHVWFGFHGAFFLTGGFGGSLILTYIVLWIVLPEASTASEKLEMRGEKVDLESIKNTIKSDLENFKGRAKDFGSEMGERFQKVGDEMRRGTQHFATEAAPIVRSTGHGIGHAIGVLFKVFFLIIAGIIAFALTMALIALFFGGTGVLNFKGYFIEGVWPNILVWASFLLFLLVPIVALLTWLIRRITGARSRRHYLGYVFATLWIIGLFSFIALAGKVLNDFRYRQHIEEEVPVAQPAHGKLLIRAMGNMRRSYEYENDNFEFHWDRHEFFYDLDEDSMNLKTVRIVLVKSTDSNYHVQLTRFSRGNDPHLASQLAGQIQFPIRQNDSVLYLPDGFTITRYQQFRNQQVLVTVAIPVGKRIWVDKNTENYQWFNVNVSRHHNILGITDGDRYDGDLDRVGDDDNFLGPGYSWSRNTEYIMSDNGLTPTDKKDSPKERTEQGQDNNPPAGHDGGGYHYKYHKDQDSSRTRRQKDTTTTAGKSTTMVMDADQSICLISALANLN